jgi:hypothetical protein
MYGGSRRKWNDVICSRCPNVDVLHPEKKGVCLAGWQSVRSVTPPHHHDDDVYYAAQNIRETISLYLQLPTHLSSIKLFMHRSSFNRIVTIYYYIFCIKQSTTFIQTDTDWQTAAVQYEQ